MLHANHVVWIDVKYIYICVCTCLCFVYEGLCRGKKLWLQPQTFPLIFFSSSTSLILNSLHWLSSTASVSSFLLFMSLSALHAPSTAVYKIYKEEFLAVTKHLCHIWHLTPVERNSDMNYGHLYTFYIEHNNNKTKTCKFKLRLSFAALH